MGCGAEPGGPGCRQGVHGPAVSVLLPVRDAAGTLPRALDSLRRQTIEDWEVVAVDDGSEDDSGRILEAAAAADPRIQVVRTPPRGLVPALELARGRARAPLIARMDADDHAEPERLACQLELLRARTDLVGCGTHVRYFPRDRVRAGLRRYERWLNGIRAPEDVDRELWVECPLAHPTFCLRAEAVDRVGGYRAMGWPEDYDLVLRLRLAEGPLGVVPRVLHHWRDSPERLSRTAPEYSEAAFRRVKLHHLARSLLDGRSGLLVCGAGPVGKAFAREAFRQGIRVVAFADLSPRRIGEVIHGAPVVHPGEMGRFRGALGVAAVGQAGARREIREAFTALGWVEGVDFVAVA
jgi:cellulose synthase/poly-beta-1,6-N-acetylglucosamine synthase-like glycosyltransferase